MKFRNFIWAFVASLVFLLVFSWSTSPLYLTYGGDSPFFQIIGLGITQGKVPYVDLFDHKGPVPFFYDALGYSLGLGRTGVFIIQVLSLTVTLLLIRKTASLFTASRKRAGIATLLALIPLAVFITEGNQVEEWQLPYIALSLYLCCRYLLSGGSRHPAWMGLVYGLCFGMVFLNRPNDGVMWVGSLFFGLVLLWIVRKRYSLILPNVGAFIGGFLCVLAPILAYFASHGALADLWYGMIVHNIQYAGDALFTWGGIGMILIPALFVTVILILTGREGYKDFRFVFIPLLVFTVVLIGKRDYYHYLIPFFPFIALAYVLCLKHGWKAFLWVVCVLFAVFTYREFTFIGRAVKEHDRLEALYEQSDELFGNVPEAERNTVWNYNLVSFGKGNTISLMGCFLHAGLTPSSPVLAAYDLMYLEGRFGVRAMEPEWLVMCPTDSYQKDFDYIFSNYEQVAATPSEPVCELRLYRRKQQ